MTVFVGRETETAVFIDDDGNSSDVLGADGRPVSTSDDGTLMEIPVWTLVRETSTENCVSSEVLGNDSEGTEIDTSGMLFVGSEIDDKEPKLLL